jgi:hypothetical protein
MVCKRDTANLVNTIDQTETDNRMIWQFYYKVVSNQHEAVMPLLGGNDAVPENSSSEKYNFGQA